jgi:hypothetical protein
LYIKIIFLLFSFLIMAHIIIKSIIFFWIRHVLIILLWFLYRRNDQNIIKLKYNLRAFSTYKRLILHFKAWGLGNVFWGFDGTGNCSYRWWYIAEFFIVFLLEQITLEKSRFGLFLWEQDKMFFLEDLWCIHLFHSALQTKIISILLIKF